MTNDRDDAAASAADSAAGARAGTTDSAGTHSAERTGTVGEAGTAQSGRPRIDTGQPHSARMYDYWLGGSSNFAADRAMGQAFEQAIPSIRTMAKENRKFLGRAVRQMVEEAGIHQFLDIGTGIPADGDTASVTAIVAPGSRIVCVDNDPIVQEHAKTALSPRDAARTLYLEKDLRKPADILASPQVRQTLDLDRPVGLLLVAILMLIGDDEDPWEAVAAFRDALPSGSHIAVTHPTADFDPRAMAEVVGAASQGHMTLVPRDRAAVTRFFGDWEILDPGVVPVMAWRPEGAAPDNPEAAYYWAGVARKP